MPEIDQEDDDTITILFAPGEAYLSPLDGALWRFMRREVLTGLPGGIHEGAIRLTFVPEPASRLRDIIEDVGLQNADPDLLVARLEELKREGRALADERGDISDEMSRRAQAARPSVLEAGTAVVVGASTETTVGFEREYAWNAPNLVALAKTCGRCEHIHAASGAYSELCAVDDCTCRHFEAVINELEHGRLVSYVMKVDGVFYNTLRRRGGLLERLLLECRTLTSAVPKLTTKERQA